MIRLKRGKKPKRVQVSVNEFNLLQVLDSNMNWDV
jgi:hypothetical protein